MKANKRAKGLMMVLISNCVIIFKFKLTSYCADPPLFRTPSLRHFLLEGLSLLPNFQKGEGFTGSQFLEGRCWERVSNFFFWGGGREGAAVFT